MNKLRLAILVITCLLSMAANAAHRSRAQVKEQPLQTDSVQVRTTTAATDSAQVHTIKAATDSAQVASAETVKGKEKKAPEKKRKLTSGEAVQTWHVQEASAIERPTQPDTLHLNYQIATTPVYINHLGAEWLGNLGLPAQSTVFSERPSLELLGDNMFLNPYRPYYLGVEDVYFYNTRVPYTNISFYTGGYTQHGEDRLKGLFT
ncbi:MAG: putative porin, partial [Bacteroidales bacterium]|nr:putative porin [Bacteroidales bacterium]